MKSKKKSVVDTTKRKKKWFIISDFEGRVDLLILFIINSGYLLNNNKTKTFIKEATSFLNSKFPKDYDDENFKKLDNLYNKLMILLAVQANVNQDIGLIFNGDFFGNRPLHGRTKDGVVSVYTSNDREICRQSGIEAGRGEIMLKGTNQQNLNNYDRIIDMNRYIKDILLQMAKTQNNVVFIAGNHELYGSSLGYLVLGQKLDGFVFLNQDTRQNYKFGRYCYKDINNYFDDLDLIKNEFISNLQNTDKRLLLYMLLSVGKQKIIVKHTKFATDGQFKNMIEDKSIEICGEKIQSIDCFPPNNFSYYNDQKKPYLQELQQFISAKSGTTTSHSLVDYEPSEVGKNILQDNNVFLIFGHHSDAANNIRKYGMVRNKDGNVNVSTQKGYIERNALCCDPGHYQFTQMCEKGEPDQAMSIVDGQYNSPQYATTGNNFFELDVITGKIKEKNLYTNKLMSEFKMNSKMENTIVKKNVLKTKAEVKNNSTCKSVKTRNKNCNKITITHKKKVINNCKTKQKGKNFNLANKKNTQIRILFCKNG